MVYNSILGDPSDIIMSGFQHNPVVSNKDLEDSMYGLPYVHIHYRSKDYRISPFDIQIVYD